MPVQSPETTVIVLAHQDDDIAFAPLIRRLKQQGAPLAVAYLTDGSGGRASSAVRDAESRRALTSLGVATSEILHVGSSLGIPDAALFRALDRAYESLEAALAPVRLIGDIYTLAWEGGHIDHDAAHAVAAALAQAHDRLDRAWQVPFYRTADRGPPWFSLFAPLPANGPVTAIPLTRDEALLRATLMRFYPSQWRVLSGLAPGLVWHGATAKALKVQPLLPQRPRHRPMEERLFYERGGRTGFDEVAAHVRAFLWARGVRGATG
jgi:LmbE family N-acetylglucosaminyl deacetylase